MYYDVTKTDFGDIAIVWHCKNNDVAICRVFFSGIHDCRESVTIYFGECERKHHDEITPYLTSFQALSQGKDICFSLHRLDFTSLTDFEIIVLKEVSAVPRGNVRSYKWIADTVQCPGGARAVGNAVAKNPFPLIIPCHRIIASDGTLGGFQEGCELKEKILQTEGFFTKTECVTRR